MRASFQKGKLRHSGVRRLGQDYTGLSGRAIAGPSLQLVEFVRVLEQREGDGAAVFVTSCDGPGKCVPMHHQNVPWERQWWAGVGLEEGRGDSAGSLGIDSCQIWGCL